MFPPSLASRDSFYWKIDLQRGILRSRKTLLWPIGRNMERFSSATLFIGRDTSRGHVRPAVELIDAKKTI